MGGELLTIVAGRSRCSLVITIPCHSLVHDFGGSPSFASSVLVTVVGIVSALPSFFVSMASRKGSSSGTERLVSSTDTNKSKRHRKVRLQKIPPDNISTGKQREDSVVLTHKTRTGSE